MMPESSLLQHLQQRLSNVLNIDINIVSTTQVSGGSINDVYCLHTPVHRFLLKLNDRYA
jgi:fructosamine-3-kinase